MLRDKKETLLCTISLELRTAVQRFSGNVPPAALHTNYCTLLVTESDKLLVLQFTGYTFSVSVHVGGWVGGESRES